MSVYKVALGCMYGIVHRELHTCAALSSQRRTFSLSEIDTRCEGQAFAESIAATSDITLVDLEGVDLSPYVDVLGVLDKLWDNRAILTHVQAQRIAQQRVKSAKSGTR
jgi:hypothetical protein